MVLEIFPMGVALPIFFDAGLCFVSI